MANIKTIKVSLSTWKELMALSMQLENGRRLPMGEVIERLLEFYKERMEDSSDDLC